MTTAKIIRTTTLLMNAEETNWLQKQIEKSEEDESARDMAIRNSFRNALNKVDKLERE